MKKILLLIIVLAAAGGAVAATMLLSPGVAVRVGKVEQGAIQEFIDERGKTRLPKTYPITMPFAGRVGDIALAEYDAVSKGEVVARIVSPDLQNDIKEAQAAVGRIRSSIVENNDARIEEKTRQQADSMVESMKSTVAAAEARLLASKERLDKTEIKLGRTKQLVKDEVEPQEALEDAELRYVESQVSYQQDVLTLASLRAAQAATNMLPDIVSDLIDKKELSRDVLEQQLNEAAARLSQAEVRGVRGEMKSPVDGIVLQRSVHSEQQLPSGAVLMSVGQLDELEIEADILTQDVVRAREGSQVEIYGPAIGRDVGNGLPGIVRKIYPAAFTKISSLGVEQQRVKVIVRFDREVLQLLRARNVGVDYRVLVRIITNEKTDAVLAPRAALFRDADGRWQVFVVRDGQALLSTVEVGLINDRHAEITNGLNIGDTLVLSPERSLTDGTRVEATW